MMQQEALNTILDHLNGVNANVEATAVISADGAIISSSLPPHLSGQRLGTIMASISYCGKYVMDSADYGNLKHILLKLISGYVLLTPAQTGEVMVAVFKTETPLEDIVADAPRLAIRLAA